jgi:hypothetical protein
LVLFAGVSNGNKQNGPVPLDHLRRLQLQLIASYYGKFFQLSDFYMPIKRPVIFSRRLLERFKLQRTNVMLVKQTLWRVSPRARILPETDYFHPALTTKQTSRIAKIMDWTVEGDELAIARKAWTQYQSSRNSLSFLPTLNATPAKVNIQCT